MTLSPAELDLLAHELAAELPGAHVQKVYVPHPRVGLLELRHPGRSLLLQLDVEPGAARVSVASARPPSPSRPIAAQGLWRAHLSGARVDGVTVQGATLQLHFSTHEGGRTIVIEIDRRGGELLLLDAASHVLGATPGDRAKARGLTRGKPYVGPPPPESLGRSRLRATSGEPGTFPVAHAIEALYGPVAAGRRLEESRAQVLSPLRAARKRLLRTIARVDADRARIAESERYRKFGDLLKPLLAKLKRGAAKALVTDYGPEGAVEIEVPLLAHLSGRENMERYYHLHKRLSRSVDRVDERRRLLESQLEALDALLAEAESAETAELEALLERARAGGHLREVRLREGATSAPTTSRAATRQPFREFVSATGHRIQVGRNARDNDTLTFRFARGNDLWLHVRGQTGSHVLVPGVGEQGPDGETLLDAAELAAHFSAARGESTVEVAATRAKYVRKPKGAAAGAVTFSQERSIALRHAPDRLARLLTGERRRS